MAARVRFGTFPGEPGFAYKTFTGGAGTSHLVELPLPVLEQVLGFVGDLQSFVRLFLTNKTMQALANGHVYLWRCVNSAVIVCGQGYYLHQAWLPFLGKFAPNLRKLVVRHTDVVHPDAYPLRNLFWQTPMLGELVYEPQPIDKDRMAYCPHTLAAPPLGFGVLPALETLDVSKYGNARFDGAGWEWRILNKLHTLKISHASLAGITRLLHWLRPPLGRLRCLVVDGEFMVGGDADGMLSKADSDFYSMPMFRQLLGYDDETGDVVGSPCLLERLEVPTLYSSPTLEEAIYVGRLPHLRALHLRVEEEEDMELLLEAFWEGGMRHLNDVRLICPNYYSITHQQCLKLLQTFPFERFSSYDFPLPSYLAKEEEEVVEEVEMVEYTYGEEEDDEDDKDEEWEYMLLELKDFSLYLLGCRTLRVLELSPGTFAGLLIGVKIWEPTAFAIIKLGQIEELVVRVPSQSTNKDGFERLSTQEHSILHTPCLKRLEMDCTKNVFRWPLRIQAPQLRDVCLDGVGGTDMLHVCEPGDEKREIRDGTAALATMVIVTHSLRHVSLLHSSALKGVRLRSSSLLELRVEAARALSTVDIDAPWLRSFEILHAPRLQHLALRSLVLPSLTISPSLICGGGMGERKGADELGPGLLTSLDVWCPSLRSFALSQYPGLRSLVVEPRELSPPANGMTTAPAIMATLLREVKIKACEGLKNLVITGAGTASLPTGALAKAATRRAPLRTPLATLEIHDCPGLQSMEVKTWPQSPPALNN